MYTYLIVFLMFSMCSTNKIKKTPRSSTSNDMEQVQDFSTYKLVAKKVTDKTLTMNGLVKSYIVEVVNFPTTLKYKTHWYEQKKVDGERSFVGTKDVYSHMSGDANPGPNAVYGDKFISAKVEFPDGTKSDFIDVFSYKYLIKPGFNLDKN